MALGDEDVYIEIKGERMENDRSTSVAIRTLVNARAKSRFCKCVRL